MLGACSHCVFGLTRKIFQKYALNDVRDAGAEEIVSCVCVCGGVLPLYVVTWDSISSIPVVSPESYLDSLSTEPRVSSPEQQ